MLNPNFHFRSTFYDQKEYYMNEDLRLNNLVYILIMSQAFNKTTIFIEIQIDTMLFFLKYRYAFLKRSIHNIFIFDLTVTVT